MKECRRKWDDGVNWRGEELEQRWIKTTWNWKARGDRSSKELDRSAELEGAHGVEAARDLRKICDLQMQSMGVVHETKANLHHDSTDSTLECSTIFDELCIVVLGGLLWCVQTRTTRRKQSWTGLGKPQQDEAWRVQLQQ